MVRLERSQYAATGQEQGESSIMGKRFQVMLLDEKGRPVEELITMPHAAEILGVTQGHVTTLATTGVIDRWHFSGKCVLVSLKQIKDHLASYEDPDRVKRGRPRSGERKAKK